MCGTVDRKSSTLKAPKQPSRDTDKSPAPPTPKGSLLPSTLTLTFLSQYVIKVQGTFPPSLLIKTSFIIQDVCF